MPIPAHPVGQRVLRQLAQKEDGVQLTWFLDGLALIDPGICLVGWRPDPDANTGGKGANVYGVVARVDRATR